MDLEFSRRQVLGLLGGLAGAAFLPHIPAEGQTMSPEPISLPTFPDTLLGSLYPFIQAQADRQPHPLAFTKADPGNLDSWQSGARERIAELLHYAPPRVEPAPEVIETVETEHFLRHRLTFATSPEVRVPAYLLVPTGVELPAPGVVLLHDHGGFYYYGKEKVVGLLNERPILKRFKEQYYGGRNVADELARQGYVVLVIDAFYFGERRLITRSETSLPPSGPTDEGIEAINQRNSTSEELVARGLLTAGITWFGVTHWDDRRSLDFLASRPEVDPERIASVGLSVGGYQSLFLGAMDERIKVAVVVGWMTRLAPCLKDNLRWTIGFSKLIAGLYHEMDLPDVGLLIAPRAFLCVNGTEDQLFPLDAVGDAHRYMADGYATVGVPDRFRSILYDGPHEFNLATQQEAWAWLRTWL